MPGVLKAAPLRGTASGALRAGLSLTGISVL
jgi:hypothetical protein